MRDHPCSASRPPSGVGEDCNRLAIRFPLRDGVAPPFNLLGTAGIAWHPRGPLLLLPLATPATEASGQGCRG